jgi:hypothetical protein
MQIYLASQLDRCNEERYNLFIYFRKKSVNWLGSKYVMSLRRLTCLQRILDYEEGLMTIFGSHTPDKESKIQDLQKLSFG